MSGRRGTEEAAASSDAFHEEAAPVGWPSWARRVVTVVLVVHLGALVAASMGSVPPSSLLQQNIAQWFVPYYDIIDQGYAYHFYAPEPPPTPVVLATVHFVDGRSDEVVRIPERGVRPRLRYQRQLALATWLFMDYQDALMSGGDGSKSRWARAYARHLCRTRTGCSSVTLHVKMHRIPDLHELGARLESNRGGRVDIDSEEYYDVPQWIGDFTCDAF
ncbi:MAG: hypothetical protein P4L84_30205 [Isosphaeraceae bacterium]|nr:hypothetical protein [Isosphaeraceae bacterium]